MTINSRAKGAGAELEFSNIVYQWSGVRLIRNLEQSRSGGHDLIVHPDEVGAIADLFRSLAIEIKRHGKVTPALIKAGGSRHEGSQNKTNYTRYWRIGRIGAIGR